MKLPSKPRSGGSIKDKVGELIDFCRSIVPLAGRGLRMTQTSGGTSLSLGNHGADHGASGRDPIIFKTITLSDGGSPEKVITLDPAAADFLADRLYAVTSDGNGTAWRTLLDLVDGLPGFAANKVLSVNAAGDALEWGADGGGDVTESAVTPFQSGKLVIASATAKELLGTLIGINLAGSDYMGYSDSDISTDARSAQISDSRFNALRGASANTFQTNGTLAFWDDAGFRILGGVTLKDKITSDFNIAALVGGLWIMGYNDFTGFQSFQTIHTFLADESGYAAEKVLAVNSAADGLEWVDGDTGANVPEGTAGKMLWHDGTDWVLLDRPANRKVLQGNSSSNPVWDYVRAH